MIQYQAKKNKQKENAYITIRPMRASDLEQVHLIDKMSFSLPWPESAFRYELFDNPNSLLWVADASQPTADDMIVGAIVIWLILDEAHIATLAIHPDYRRRGIGERLLVTALGAVMQSGSKLATLEVRAGNFAAQALYQKFHFKIVGRRLRYYQDNNEDALIMTLEPLDESYCYWLESGEWQVTHKLDI